jgi:hypothetical protein
MTDQPYDPASVRDLEADIADTRERLAGSVDQLAAKLDVKTQAAEKIQATKAQAGEVAAEVKQQVVETSRSLLSRFRAASRPVQVSLAATPVALLIMMVARRARG